MARHKWRKEPTDHAYSDHCAVCGGWRLRVPCYNQWRTEYRIGNEQFVVAGKGDKTPACPGHFLTKDQPIPQEPNGP